MALKPCKYGHSVGRDAQSHCLECKRLTMNKKRADDPEKSRTRDRTYHAANRERRNEDGCRHYRTNFKKTMLRNARKRAQQGGYPCTITEADIHVPKFCPLLGIEIRNGRPLSASPSLDKIVPALGYVPGNVWVISHRANQIKSDATLRELELLVANLKNKCTNAPGGSVQQNLTMPWTTFDKPGGMPWQ